MCRQHSSFRIRLVEEFTVSLALKRRWRSTGSSRGSSKLSLLLGLTLVVTACVFWRVRQQSDSSVEPTATSPAAIAARRPDAGVTGHHETASASPPFADWFGLSPAELRARWNAWRGDPYPLDGVARRLNEGAKVVCERENLVRYAGETLRYQTPVTVIPAFRQRLLRFEQVVAEVAQKVYGRAPRQIRHVGAFACRTSRNRAQRVSEHALGNAIDVTGFDFGPVPADFTGDLPKSLRGWFRVSVGKHWTADSGPSTEIHARFLRQLIERLRARGDVFRSMIGPPHPRHAEHFHFDMAPWRYVWL